MRRRNNGFHLRCKSKGNASNDGETDAPTIPLMLVHPIAHKIDIACCNVNCQHKGILISSSFEH